MIEVSTKFQLPSDRVWLNAAHQGPLPKQAANAVSEVVRWKLQPHHLQNANAFSDIPNRLRSVLSRLVDANESDIVLANSASYGLHLIANGLELASDDEVLVASTDFPSDILPWINLERRGVIVNQIRPAAKVVTVDEVVKSFTTRTRVLCLTWVHSFSGHVIDLDAIGSACRSANVLFVVNGAQGIGALPLNVSDHPIDALTSVGFKWLCGPYGTGFCWLGSRVSERMHPTKLYWLNALSTDDLAKPDIDLSRLSVSRTGRHDIFGTANFFNYAAFIEAVELIVSIGTEKIHTHNLELSNRLIDGIDLSRYEILDRGNSERLTSILFLRPKRGSIARLSKYLSSNCIDVAERSGMIRLSPHFYNSTDDINRALTVLNEWNGL